MKLNRLGEDLADSYRVLSYPTLILMDADGYEIARSRGYKNAEQFLSWLDGALATARSGDYPRERTESAKRPVVL